mmetsp:Transcript_10446/g.33174  ORF Transcript_10446/g.33174 Transcript_10446/m.33174 type:complete len:494 (-) Transcript_10446:3738-5219(-)
MSSRPSTIAFVPSSPWPFECACSTMLSVPTSSCPCSPLPSAPLDTVLDTTRSISAIIFTPKCGTCTFSKRSPCSVMVASFRYGSSSVPISSTPPWTMMYVASSDSPSRRSNTSSPCTSSKNSSGGDTSSRTVCPAGITTLSPARGGSWSRHVVSHDHRSKYRNEACGPTAAARPTPDTSTSTDSGRTSSRARVTHRTLLDVELTTSHSTPFRRTLTSDEEVGNPDPSSVTSVPPNAVPFRGHTDVTLGVTDSSKRYDPCATPRSTPLCAPAAVSSGSTSTVALHTTSEVPPVTVAVAARTVPNTCSSVAKHSDASPRDQRKYRTPPSNTLRSSVPTSKRALPSRSTSSTFHPSCAVSSFHTSTQCDPFTDTSTTLPRSSDDCWNVAYRRTRNSHANESGPKSSSTWHDESPLEKLVSRSPSTAYSQCPPAPDTCPPSASPDVPPFSSPDHGKPAHVPICNSPGFTSSEVTSPPRYVARVRQATSLYRLHSTSQ